MEKLRIFKKKDGHSGSVRKTVMERINTIRSILYVLGLGQVYPNKITKGKFGAVVESCS